MIVYQADKRGFLADHDDRDIESVIQDRYRLATGRRIAQAEMRAWRESLTFMARVLRDDQIPGDTGVAVEYQIPQSSKRIDITLTGYGDDGNRNLVVVELKQWEIARATAKDAIIVTYMAGAQRELVHPSYQAWSYAGLLRDFNEAVYSGGIDVHPCAYLHNYARDGVIDSPHYRTYIERAPLFLKGESERQSLRDFIKQYVKRGDAGSILYDIEAGKVRPSKALADSLSSLMRGNPEFILVDDQKTVYEAALAAATASDTGVPRVVIIQGGPGTGKTVVAINLLVELTAKRFLGKYVSRNAAPRVVYHSRLTRSMTASRFKQLFSGSGQFIATAQDAYQFLVVDEAHRLNERSGLYGNLGEHQVKELINAGRCAIFFIDEDQRVTLSDIGSRELIRAFAKQRGAHVEEYELSSQFRCNGSDGYLAWLDHTLGIRETANTTLDTGQYDFRVFDDPTAMHEAIEACNGSNKARVVAGYCWRWQSKANEALFDIEIGDNYRRRWNLAVDGSLWIIAPHSVHEVGCIHTCQGLEVEYIGVIVGPDFLVRNGQVVTNPLARDRHDKSMKGIKSWLKRDPAAAQREAGIIIKNTYRTLMTRGLKGCFVYCTDAETREYFKSSLTVAG